MLVYEISGARSRYARHPRSGRPRAWWEQAIEHAVATTGSAEDSPHSANPRLDVRINGAFFVRALTSWKNRLAPAGGDRQNNRSHRRSTGSSKPGSGILSARRPSPLARLRALYPARERQQRIQHAPRTLTAPTPKAPVAQMALTGSRRAEEVDDPRQRAMKSNCASVRSRLRSSRRAGREESKLSRGLRRRQNVGF